MKVARIQRLLIASLSLALATTFVGCGDDSEDRDLVEAEGIEGEGQNNGSNDGSDSDRWQPTAETVDMETVAVDEELSTQQVTSQVDVALSAMADLPAVESEGLSLRGAQIGLKAKRHRVCTASEGVAAVEIRREIERNGAFDGRLRATSFSLEHYGQINRNWSKAESSVDCHEGGKHALVPWNEMEGVSLALSFDRYRKRTASVTNKLRDVTRENSFEFSAEGSRNVTWDSVVDSDDTRVLSKTITSDVARSLQTKDRQGNEKSISTQVKTAEGAPLMVDSERDLATLALQARTIKSGTLESTGPAGGRLTTTFINVRHEQGATFCQATSGQIEGAFYAKDATEPTVTFTIDFDADEVMMVFSDGREQDYAPEGCSLEDPEDLVDVDSAEEVEDGPAAEETPAEESNEETTEESAEETDASTADEA